MPGGTFRHSGSLPDRTGDSSPLGPRPTLKAYALLYPYLIMPARTILHVEDEPADALFVRRAIHRKYPHWKLLEAQDGQQAIDYLSGASPYSDRSQFPLPDLLLLDLKLPVLDGFEVLSWARTTTLFRALPIVVLSGSGLPEDRARAAALGATDYFVKTPLYEDIVEFVGHLLCETPSADLLGQAA